MNAFIALVRKDLVLYFSNRRAVVMSIAAPILIAAFFGSLFGNRDSKPANIPVAITDLDHSELSARVVAAMRADSALTVSDASPADALAQVKAGTLRASILLPAGFGAKAGLVPLHVWLPEAHPAAPSPVSALMSGVMLKIAVYGLLRVGFDLLPHTQWAWGAVALALGAITGLFGAVFAADSELDALLGAPASLDGDSHRTNIAVNCFAPTVLAAHFGSRMRDYARATGCCAFGNQCDSLR